MRVVVCDPIMSAHHKHLPHFTQWYAEASKKHELILHMEIGKALHKVQNAAVRVAMDMNASHILFTEHDHWGYPVDGLDVLLDADKDVIGLPTYMRGYPYLPMCMYKVDPDISFITDERNLRSFYPNEVMQKTDLITWAFTLVRTDVFRRMEEAGRTPWVWDSVPTDSHFCQICEDMDIDRWIHASYFVNHGDHPKEVVTILRRAYDAINAQSGRFPVGALVKDDTQVAPQNDDDPHGVVPYKTQLEEILEDKRRHHAALEIARPICPVQGD